jgi:DNA-binding response OmpR family regulator
MQNVLLVAPTPTLATTVFACLAERDWKVTLVTSFAIAKARLEDLESRPSLLISEIRLGGYNGLHLAIHAQAHHIPAVVVGDYDPVLRRDAAGLGSPYLTYDLDPADLIRVIERLPIKAEANVPRTYSDDTNLTFVSWNGGESRYAGASEFVYGRRRPSMAS